MADSSFASKIITVDQIPQLSAITGKRVLVGGCFDILHYGHTSFLSNARQEGDCLIIMLESDEFIKKYKKRDPVHSQDQRALILANLIVVDFIIKLPFLKSDEEYSQLVKKIRPSLIAVTAGDPRIEEKKVQAEEMGAEVKVVVDQLPFASSKYASIFRD